MNAPARLTIQGLAIALVLPLTGCISNGKYQDMVTQRNSVVTERDRLAGENSQLESEVDNLRSQLLAMTQERDAA